uniref:Polyprotein n=1 Tax=Oryza sativa subsp. japonica TaxID=39947 RepID=Q8W2S4_ORYSJ|nr:putative polyprotein [Oryza sativa Japonica Group]
MNAYFTLCSCYTEYTASLSGTCFGAGIVFAYAITLCHDDDIRVVSGSLDVVPRLRDIIIWGYMQRMRGGSLMVTAQYGYSSARVYNSKLIPWGGYSSVFSPGCMAMMGCRKELGSQGWLLEVPGEHRIEEKGKRPSHRATRFVKSNGKYCSKCREVGHLVNDCPGGCASNSKAYQFYNKNRGIVEETADVQFGETNGTQEGHENLDDVGDEGLMRAMKNMSIGDVKEFDMSLIGELSFFLGLQIKQLKDGTFVSQTKYIKDLLKRFGLEDAKPIKTPMATNGHLALDEEGKLVDLKLYRSMIGSLLYLTTSRPDIMFSVCMCARFQAAPKECHLVAVKSILRYLKHSSTIGLWYPKSAKFMLVGYSDSGYAGCKVDRKSTSGSCQMFGRSLVSWSSKKQNSVALSTAEEKYVSVGSCCAQLLWMKQTLLDDGITFNKTPLLCDNDDAIKIANNPVQHSRTKHIDIHYHFLRDHIAKSNIVISHIRTEHQLADIFTKPLDETCFCKLMNELNVIDFSNVA